jgi:hypothetical protein
MRNWIPAVTLASGSCSTSSNGCGARRPTARPRGLGAEGSGRVTAHSGCERPAATAPRTSPPHAPRGHAPRTGGPAARPTHIDDHLTPDPPADLERGNLEQHEGVGSARLDDACSVAMRLAAVRRRRGALEPDLVRLAVGAAELGTLDPSGDRSFRPIGRGRASARQILIPSCRTHLLLSELSISTPTLAV